MEVPISSFSTPELVAEITMLAGHLNAANARFRSWVAELDRRRGWAEWGVKSCAHWLNWKCGIELGAGREKIRVADTGNESYLLNIALCGTASHVEDVVRGDRRALDAAELTREAVQQRDQCLWWRTEADGSLDIRGRLPAEVGALFVRALQAAVDGLPIPKDVSAETSSDDLHRSRKRRVEALAALAESFLATGPRDVSGADRQQVVVHVDAETLQHPHAGRCELEHGASIAAETARRLSCDASVVRIVEDATGEPLDVGRRTRTIPPGIRRALQARDRGCRFPGCTFKRYVDGHHVRHWADGGETKLANLVTLCRFHHRVVHEGQMLVQALDDGAFRFTRPNGESLESGASVPTGWTELVAANASADIRISPSTAVTSWTGEAPDLDEAVGWLMQKAVRLRVPESSGA